MSPIRIACVGQTTNTRGFESYVDAVRAEVTLLGRMIFRIDKDASYGHAAMQAFTADANRFVEIHDTSARLNIAVVGQALTHGACAH